MYIELFCGIAYKSEVLKTLCTILLLGNIIFSPFHHQGNPCDMEVKGQEK